MTTNRTTNRTTNPNSCCIALIITALLGACGEEPADLSRDQMLDNLGVNTELGARKTPDGGSVSSTYHPMGSKRRTLAPLSELFFAGASVGGKYTGLLDDNEDGKLGELWSDGEAAWKTLPLVAARGDVDGDGFDEVVVAYYVAKENMLKLRVIDRQSDGSHVASKHVVAKNLSTNKAIDSYASMSAGFMFMDLVAADVDGDGSDELAVAFGDTLRLLDDLGAKLAPLASRRFASGDKAAPHTVLRLAAGRLAAGAGPRLVVVANHLSDKVAPAYCDYFIYDGALQNEITDQLTAREGATTHVFKLAFVAVGDIDGDRLDEIVFNGATDTASYLVMMDDQRAGGKRIGGLTSLGALASKTTAVALLDLDGDGIEEIAASGQLFDHDTKTGKLVARQEQFLAASWRYAAGDLDGDHREDLVCFHNNAIHIWGVDESGVFQQRKSVPAPAGAYYPTLVTANTDDDSLVLEYTGSTELMFSDPQVIAVMAAAPSWAGLGQDGSTTFGKLKGTEAEASASLGFSVGFTIGAKAGFKLFGNGVEAEVSKTFKASMDFVATASTSIQTAYAFTGGADEDKVVFTAIPFDVYYYKVLSSPDPKAVGQIITINLPREPQTFSVSRSYYNANNGDNPDVDATVLQHQIGKPFSYPTRSDRDLHLQRGLALLKKGWANLNNPTHGGWVNDTMVTVGQGSGSQTLSIEATRSIGAGVEVELSTETSAQVEAGPAIVGGSFEARVGVGLSITASEGFFVEGEIGDIPAEHYGSERLYRAGLYAYPHQGTSGSFMVVNYWVEK